MPRQGFRAAIASPAGPGTDIVKALWPDVNLRVVTTSAAVVAAIVVITRIAGPPFTPPVSSRLQGGTSKGDKKRSH